MKSKIENKKGQISYFIIAGIVLLIIVGFIIYLMSSVVRKETEEEVERVKEQAFSTQQIESYVTECLRKTAENALDLLGKQGGVIYTIQGGTMNGPFSEGERHVKYDYNNNNDGTDDCIVREYSNDPNNPLSSPCSINHGIYLPAPGVNGLPSLIARTDAIDTALETYIENEISFTEACNVKERFSSQGFDITLNPSDIKVTFILSDKDINVKLKAPMDIKDKATGKKEQIEDFSTNLNVRLNLIYRFANTIIERDIRESNFDIEFTDGEISSKIINTVISNGATNDIIEVKDGGSMLRGQPYSFFFARANRPPTITVLGGTENWYYSDTKSLTIDVMDPDEEPLTGPAGLTYSALGANPPTNGIFVFSNTARFDSNTKTFSWTPGRQYVNSDGDFTITATDTGGLSTSNAFHIDVDCSRSGADEPCCDSTDDNWKTNNDDCGQCKRCNTNSGYEGLCEHMHEEQDNSPPGDCSESYTCISGNCVIPNNEPEINILAPSGNSIAREEVTIQIQVKDEDGIDDIFFQDNTIPFRFSVLCDDNEFLDEDNYAYILAPEYLSATDDWSIISGFDQIPYTGLTLTTISNTEFEITVDISLTSFDPNMGWCTIYAYTQDRSGHYANNQISESKQYTLTP